MTDTPPFEPSRTSAAPSGTGRFSTGETAASYAVRLTCRDDGLVIEFIDARLPPRLWPYGRLTTDTPIDKRSRDALIGSTTDPRSQLFIADPTILASLPSRARSLTPSAMRRAQARPWIVATLAIVAALAAFWYSNISPAAMLARFLPERARATLGEQAMNAMVGDHRRCNDNAGARALDALASRLASDPGSPHFDIVVVDSDVMNAFAVPGDRIVLTRGLLESAGDADEVAGVLAHEMGHGIKRHPEAAFLRAIGLSATAELISGGTGGSLVSIGILLAQLSYSRDNEREADETGLILLRAGRVSAKGLGRFFERVLKDEGSEKPGQASAYDRAMSLLRTHPPTEARRRMVASVPDYPATPSLTQSDWQALKAICTHDPAKPSPQ